MVEYALIGLTIVCIFLSVFYYRALKERTWLLSIRASLYSSEAELKKQVAELTVERNHLKHSRDTNAKIIEQLTETNHSLKAKIKRFYEGEPLYEVKLVISEKSSISFLDTPKPPPLNLIDLSKPIKPTPAKEKRLRLSLYTGILILQEDNLLFDREELKEKCAELMATYLADTYPQHLAKNRA